MSNNNFETEVDLDVIAPHAPGNQERQQGNNNERANIPNPNNTQFGVVRDRLFHAMLVKIALSYNARVSRKYRRIIEFISLSIAIFLLSGLLFVHLMFTRSNTSCFDHVKDVWNHDGHEGVLRVEVVKNLDVLLYKEELMEEWKSQRASGGATCYFDPADVLRMGPAAIPAEIRFRHFATRAKTVEENAAAKDSGILSLFLKSFPELEAVDDQGDDVEELLFSTDDDGADEELRAFEQNYYRSLDESEVPSLEYLAEYSLLYGTLRLSSSYRKRYGIPEMTVRIDADSPCFGEPFIRYLKYWFVGYEDGVMASLRSLAVGQKDIGYLHDLRTNEHYHFVPLMMGKTGYLSAAFVMVIFTFAISMLLRFSHHQIFLFIVDLLHMFELNQPLVFPAAPLLTVILALVGMEAIMSEVFADTTTAFYVILVVWIADQFDAICCHSPISKRYWLRFFYLYQFFFYAYQYRFGGHYGGIALVTSSALILHSMIFFFHHYEMPLILYQDRLQRILSDIQHNPPINGTTAAANVNELDRTRDISQHAEVVLPTTSSASTGETVHLQHRNNTAATPAGSPTNESLRSMSDRFAQEITRSVLEEVRSVVSAVVNYEDAPGTSRPGTGSLSDSDRRNTGSERVGEEQAEDPGRLPLQEGIDQESIGEGIGEQGQGTLRNLGDET